VLWLEVESDTGRTDPERVHFMLVELWIGSQKQNEGEGEARKGDLKKRGIRFLSTNQHGAAFIGTGSSIIKTERTMRYRWLPKKS